MSKLWFNVLLKAAVILCVIGSLVSIFYDPPTGTKILVVGIASWLLSAIHLLGDN